MIGTPRAHWRLTDSTNERAKELADTGAPHGTIVTADEQSAGRGRQGRTWAAPPGSAVLLSLLVRGLEERHALLPLAAAVAVCEAAEATVPGVSCAIKWPNDVWIERRKLAGILIEGRPQEGWAVLGIGLNVTTRAADLPEELRETATSLAIAAGTSPAVEDVLSALLERLDDRLGSAPHEILGAWRERDALRGEHVDWGAGEGVAAGIDDAGALLVETNEGRRTLGAGEVHLRR